MKWTFGNYAIEYGLDDWELRADEDGKQRWQRRGGVAECVGDVTNFTLRNFRGVAEGYRFDGDAEHACGYVLIKIKPNENSDITLTVSLNILDDPEELLHTVALSTAPDEPYYENDARAEEVANFIAAHF
jgi:hypothetical protein